MSHNSYKSMIHNSYRSKRKHKMSMKKNDITFRIEYRNSKTYVHFYKGFKKMTYKEGIKNLINNKNFRTILTNILRDIEGSYMWKLTAINNNYDYNRKDKYFKFVTIPSKFHHVVQDSTKFEEQLNDKDNKISKSFVFFNSPSGNGLLVPMNIVPGSTNVYTHFSNFIRSGKTSQINEFWKTFGMLVDKYLNGRDKLYINTHGHDVPWLHVRFDHKPDKIIWKH